MLDTSVCIPALRGERALKERIRAMSRAAIASMAAAEIWHGVHLCDERFRAEEEARVERMLRAVRIVPFDRAAARAWARIAASILDERFEELGANDVVIAATAISRNMVLATRDARSFPEIPGLRFELW